MHDLRVAGRRTRAALMFFRDAWAEPGPLRLKNGIRRVARRLGPLRDLEASRDILAASWDLMRGHALRTEAAAARHYIEALLDRRLRMKTHPAEKELQALLRELDRVPQWKLPASDPPRPRQAEEIQRALRKRLRMFARPVERMLPRRSGDAHEWHEYRIRIKKYRYALELAQSQGIPGLRNKIRRLAAIQDLLGEHHDISVLISLLTRRTSASAGRAVQGNRLEEWFARRQKKLIRSAHILAKPL